MATSSKRKTISRTTTVVKDGQLVEITAKAVKNEDLPATSHVSATKTSRTKPSHLAADTNSKLTKKQARQKAQTAVDALIDDTDDLVKNQVGGFITFIREHAIVGLAVGFIIGAQAQAVVKQLVASFIDPMLKLVVGSNLSNASFHVGAAGSGGADFAWGAMIYSLINLLAVLTAIYMLIKVLKLDKLDMPKA